MKSKLFPCVLAALSAGCASVRTEAVDPSVLVPPTVSIVVTNGIVQDPGTLDIPMGNRIDITFVLPTGYEFDPKDGIAFESWFQDKARRELKCSLQKVNVFLCENKKGNGVLSSWYKYTIRAVEAGSKKPLPPLDPWINNQ